MTVIESANRYLKLLRKYRDLELRYEDLRENVKNECFKKLLEKIGEPIEIERLRVENRRLKLKNKELKQKLKND